MDYKRQRGEEDLTSNWKEGGSRYERGESMSEYKKEVGNTYYYMYCTYKQEDDRLKTSASTACSGTVGFISSRKKRKKGRDDVVRNPRGVSTPCCE